MVLGIGPASRRRRRGSRDGIYALEARRNFRRKSLLKNAFANHVRGPERSGDQRGAARNGDERGVRPKTSREKGKLGQLTGQVLSVSGRAHMPA